MVSAINNFGGFYRKEVYFHEAQMHGGIINQPCVNQSEVLACLIEKNIYVGFSSIDGFNLNTSERIVEERTNHGPYVSLHDFIDRLGIGIEHLELLIYATVHLDLQVS